MKKFTILCIVIAFTLALTAFAEVKNDILYIPKTSMAPTVDGLMDPIYQNQSEVLAVLEDPSDAVIVDDWFDNFGHAYLLWDDTNLYFFLEVYDDLINAEGGDHNYDGVELYFDADDSKTEAAYDGLDDIQLRFNVGEFETDQIDEGYGNGGTNWGIDKAAFDYIVEETDLGWNLEFAVPYDVLQLAPGATFGFDIQINDADESTRETMLRWWQDADNANDQWQNASLFGTAMMRMDEVVSETFPIPEAAAAPTIDGSMGASEWADSWQVSGNIFDSALDVYTVWDWSDMRYTANLMWKDDNLFMYMTVIDDYINAEGGDFNYDGVEIYFDADNSKGDVYDGIDDLQLRFNVGETETSQIDVGYGNGTPNWGFVTDGIDYVVEETAIGWDLEVSFTLGDLQISPGDEFGFDIQLNDADEETRGNNMIRWWSDSNDEWQNASYFGTVNLVAGTAVEQDAPAVVSTFKLNQNYPNPFNPSTNISYSIAKMSPVTLTVYNLMGEQIATLVDEVKPAGEYNVSFDASNLTSGVYLYTLNTDGKVFTNKMMLMK